MSYLVLDRTKINYISPQITSGGVILSQIIDSKIFPENPVLISSVQELDIYFGDDFKEREYFEELISGDATLLLTTPRKPESQEKPVIDTSRYKEVSSLEIPGLEGNIDLEIRYSDQLPDIGEKNTKYYVSEEKEYYIWEETQWIKVSEIPTYIDPGSIVNRDCLRLTSKDWGEKNGLSWCWPRYSSREWTPEYTETPDSESLLGSIRDNNGLPEDKSIGFLLDFSGIQGKMTGLGDDTPTYLVVPLPGDKKIQFYIDSPIPPEQFRTEGGDTVRIEGSTLEEQISGIISELNSRGWTCTKRDEEGHIWELYSKDLLQDFKFYNIPGLRFQGDQRITHDILSILSEENKRIEFFSKLIGKGTETIEVEVKKLQEKTDWYRVMISKGSYQEVYEGPLSLEVDEETDQYISLEKTINSSSLLVNVKVWGSEGSLPEGTYILSGATEIDPYTPDDYWRGLKCLQEFEVSEDFLMIPRIEDYLRTGATKTNPWYTEYRDLLEYSVSKNCQVLISNHPYTFGCDSWGDPRKIETRPSIPIPGRMYFFQVSPEVISAESWDGERWITHCTSEDPRWYEIIETFSPEYTGNQIFNYLETDNRLVYFYRDMTYLGWTRPAWYIFLRGLMSGVYSMEVNDIIYLSPAEFYTEDKVPLEGWKSNYMSSNGHIYYYRKFFSHPGDWKYTTTILSRFCMDKVSNTVSREFPKYLSKETTGEILRGLRRILGELRGRYPIIGNLEVDYIEENQTNQTLSVYLSLGIREILDKDIKLSVTLNFN